ncbi:MAG: M66 family metalloprotease [Myxococcota bacterium]|jgi:hypothetical protein|nr:M66 family metalloprotease [Myxococcota bacterium]
MNAKRFAIMTSLAFSGLILSSCEGKDQSDAQDTTSTDTNHAGSDTETSLGAIDAVFFAQTHVQQPDHEYFTLVGNRETLIKAHVVAPEKPKAPAVKAILALNDKTLELPLTGPENLPASISIEPGVVQHSYEDSFTGFIPKEWMQPGLSVTVEAASDRKEFNDLKIGAPTKVIMTMFDVQYFADTNGDYPTGWQEELAAKWPISELEVRRLSHVVFPTLVVPPRAGVVAARVSSKDEYLVKTGLPFDGEQAAALEWKSALKAAAGTGGRISLYYVNIYGANAGGQAGGFGGVGNGTSAGILNHELGHALSLGDCYGGDPNYPYKGEMYGIPQPEGDNDIHVGPTWAFYVYARAFIPPTVQPSAVGGTVGTFKRDPMCGGGQGDQEQGYLMRHFSDYSVSKMRSFLEEHVLIWSETLGSYASWDSESKGYTEVVSNNGVSYPVERDVSVRSVMASVSGANSDVNMVYPPIGPYVAGLIELFDPRQAADRTEAETAYCPSGGCDVSLKIMQGGVEKIYMLAASWDTSADPLNGNSLTTKALNLRASDGEVTRVDLLLTPDAEHNGLPGTPTVLYSWTK